MEPIKPKKVIAQNVSRTVKTSRSILKPEPASRKPGGCWIHYQGARYDCTRQVHDAIGQGTRVEWRKSLEGPFRKMEPQFFDNPKVYFHLWHQAPC